MIAKTKGNCENSGNGNGNGKTLGEKNLESFDRILGGKKDDKIGKRNYEIGKRNYEIERRRCIGFIRRNDLNTGYRDPEDILQDYLIKARRGMKNYRHEINGAKDFEDRSLRGFLAAIRRYTVFDVLRKRDKLDKNVIGLLETDQEASNFAYSRDQKEELLEYFSEGIEYLSEIERSALTMRLSGEGIEEIGPEIGEEDKEKVSQLIFFAKRKVNDYAVYRIYEDGIWSLDEISRKMGEASKKDVEPSQIEKMIQRGRKVERDGELRKLLNHYPNQR